MQALLLLALVTLCGFVENADAVPTIPDVGEFSAQYSGLPTNDIIKQAVQGDVLAQHELGNRLALGQGGLPRNPSEAAVWFSRAAQRGFPGSPSLDTLPNAPVRIDRTSTSSNNPPPVARLAAPDAAQSSSLTQTLDGSASSGNEPINRVIWDVAGDANNDPAAVVISPSSSAQVQIQFPDYGSWFVTLIVIDAQGRLDHVIRRVELQQSEPQSPIAPNTIGPVNESIAFNEVANFQWEPLNGAITYEFELRYSESGISEPLFTSQLAAAACEDLTCAIPLQLDHPSFGEYTWRVRAQHAAGVSEWTESTFTLSPPAPDAPLNLTPLAGTDVNAGGSVTFVWQANAQVDTYDFHFFERITGDEVEFEFDILASAVCLEDECSLARVINLPISDNHAWRVRARNAGGVSAWSRSVFNVIEPVIAPPAKPVLVMPVAGGIVEAGLSHSFTWIPADLASAYEFQLINGNPDQIPLPDDAIDAFVPVSNCTTTLCSFSVAVELPVGSEPIWRVRSVNPVGESEWVESSIVIVAVALAKPDVPTVVSPAVNADLIVNAASNFVWQHDPQAATYEFHFFDNAPGPNRGARVPFITDLRPQDLCVGAICTYSALVDLPVFSSHAWRVRARNSLGVSGWTRTPFNAVEPVTDPPSVPATIQPLADAILEVDTTVNFSWSAQESATQYEVHILDSEDDSFSAITAFVPAANCTSSTCLLSLELTFPLSDHYQWQVSASNAAGASDFAASPFSLIPAATTAPETPENLIPVVGLQLSVGDNVDFTWIRDVNAVNYEFHFFDNALGTTTPYIVGLLARDICTDTHCTLTVPVDLPVATDHAWRVRGQNSLGYSPWSRSEFDVIELITEPPSAFVLIAPTSGETLIQNSIVNFSWQTALRANEYEISLFDGTDTNTPPFQATLLASTCSVEQCNYSIPMTLPVAENHSWQVRAVNALGESESFISSFAVGLEGIDSPQIPVALLPDAGAAFITGTTVDFQWQADIDATTYEFYLTDAIEGALPITSGLLPADLCDAGVCTHSVVLDLTVDELHTWHVRVLHDDIASGWSQRAIRVVDNVGDGSPIAQFVFSGFAGDASGVAPLIISVDPSGSFDDEGILTYEWNFGDLTESISSANNDVISHEYIEPGTYTVTLTVTDATELSATTTATVIAFDSATAVSAINASRLLTQATFGPNMSSILEVQSLGMENWIEQQFTLQGPPHLDYVQQHSNGSNRHPRHEVWWRDVVDGDDQLRQRVAFALSQIFVAADTGYTLANAQYGITHYYDLLREQAFGNYRELLETITLNPVMGLYLSMLQNAKGDPVVSTRADENYAREVLQLFSIGLHQLNLDGSTDGTPSFTQDNIEAFARAFTGWNYADAGRWNRPLFTNADLISSMRPFEEFHDTESKALLNSGFYRAANNGVSPAGQNARQDMKFALDNIFNHPNVGPFIAKQLIKRLVTSNPSANYISDVASVFNDNGTGVRGDLKAVVREILLNNEARAIPSFAAYGKLREPVLRLTHLWRAFDVQPGSQSTNRGEYNTSSPQLMNLEMTTGQAVLKSPSVFNFFQPSFSPAGPVADQNLEAPEFELFTESNELATTNRIGRQIQQQYAGNPSGGLTASFLNFSDELSLASDTKALLDHLDLVLLSGNMSDALNTTLSSHLNDLPDTPAGLSQRVRDAVTLIMASPDYLVQM